MMQTTNWQEKIVRTLMDHHPHCQVEGATLHIHCYDSVACILNLTLCYSCNKINCGTMYSGTSWSLCLDMLKVLIYTFSQYDALILIYIHT